MWSLLFARQRPALDGAMCHAFLEGLDRAGLDPQRMPRHKSLSKRLREATGWRIETVPGLIPVADFFALLREHRFPSPEWIRHLDDLEYTPEPDLFHDVFGHVPQLFSNEIRALIEALAELSRSADDSRFVELERIYWFTIEFGLVMDQGRLRALGAGLASSIAELQRALGSEVDRVPFETVTARRATFEHDRMQPMYMVAPSLGWLQVILRGVAPVAAQGPTGPWRGDQVDPHA